MKKYIKITAIVGLLCLAMVLNVKNCWATNIAIMSLSGNCSVEIVRHVTSAADKISNTFWYEITPASDNPGVVDNMTKRASIQFSGIAPNENHEATVASSIDICDTTFSKVGIYRFVVTETSTSDPALLPVDTRSSVFEVNVENVLDENGNATGDLRAYLPGKYYKLDTGEKTAWLDFTNRVDRTYIELSNKVQGVFADTNKYFVYTFTILDEKYKDYSFSIKGIDRSIYYGGKDISQVTDFKGSDSIKIYLKHGQTAYIGIKTDSYGDTMQVPVDMSYVVTQDEDSNYTTSIGGAIGLSTNEKRATNVAAADDESGLAQFDLLNRNAFINIAKESDIPNTGIVTYGLPFVGLILLSGAILVVYKKINSKD